MRLPRGSAANPFQAWGLEWALISASESTVLSLPVPKESATPFGKGHWKGHFPLPVYQDFQTAKAGPVLERAQNLGTKIMDFCGKKERRFFAPLLHKSAQEETRQELLNCCAFLIAAQGQEMRFSALILRGSIRHL